VITGVSACDGQYRIFRSLFNGPPGTRLETRKTVLARLCATTVFANRPLRGSKSGGVAPLYRGDGPASVSAHQPNHADSSAYHLRRDRRLVCCTPGRPAGAGSGSPLEEEAFPPRWNRFSARAKGLRFLGGAIVPPGLSQVLPLREGAKLCVGPKRARGMEPDLSSKRTEARAAMLGAKPSPATGWGPLIYPTTALPGGALAKRRGARPQFRRIYFGLAGLIDIDSAHACERTRAIKA
jgi:hypothetical protein